MPAKGDAHAVGDQEFDGLVDAEAHISTPRSGSSISKDSTMHGKVDERSRLLPAPEHGIIIEMPSERPRRMSHQTVILLLTLIILLAACGDQLMDSPQTRIIESIICYRYYEQQDSSKIHVGAGPGAVGGVAEILCKVDAVQEDLAMLRGYARLWVGDFVAIKNIC